MQDDQIKRMAERFLTWKLPENFNPDGGISFTPEFNVEYMAALGEPPMRHEPTGTNLFDYTQAVAMVQHMIEGFDLETENKHLRRRIAELERACIKAAAPDFMTAAEKEALQDFLQFLRSSETDAPSADKIARLQRERDQAVEALRLIETAPTDYATGPDANMEYVRSIARHTILSIEAASILEDRTWIECMDCPSKVEVGPFDTEAEAVTAWNTRAALEASGLVEQAARADLSRVFYAKALESLRGAVALVVDGLDDEGDRVYLGSTNHVDVIRDAWQEMDALAWDEIMEDTQPKTELAAVNLQLQERLADQSEQIKAMQDRLATAREALETALDVFQRYAVLHAAKDTKDGREKSKANSALALEMAAALDAIKEKNGGA